MTVAETKGQPDKPIRYAVCGLGWFAQVAILPAFENAAENSRLVALISGDAQKLDVLGTRYGVPPEHRGGYDRYEEILAAAEVDAVYVATPNHLHREHTVRAAGAGVHVLCEKPMAVDEEECREMIDACGQAGVQLMIAYRLHFEEANLTAAEAVRSGRLGEARFFSSVFSNRVTNEDDIRLGPIAAGGGSLYDIGTYCVNAARSLFCAEPTEVSAMQRGRPRPLRRVRRADGGGDALPGRPAGQLHHQFFDQRPRRVPGPGDRRARSSSRRPTSSRTISRGG
jgi:predicted dehydrogenase